MSAPVMRGGVATAALAAPLLEKLGSRVSKQEAALAWIARQPFSLRPD